MVLNTMPATLHPHDGDVDLAFIHLIPTLREVFDIPSAGGGDVEYIQYLMDNPLKADFNDLVANPQLFDRWIVEMEAVGTKTGLPREIKVCLDKDDRTRRDLL